ncbi:hypothetical protein [Mycobacterium gastri]|uniref:hypothetical protein n=1 Tax=Mycobacterium gastri TaxID=1777 RepID=UPI0003E55AB8|nr:hypothetical protein [Mycobacterium gastri]ETW26195.1 hypothetical protein MGAST_28705 [Mycobacterium gastri 'Wayne']
MMETLRVVPEVLTRVGYALANHGESLLVLHQSCHGAAEGARSGWVGSSAGALSGLLGSWETVSATHADRFGEHSCGMHLAAVGFAEMDQSNAAALAAVRAQAGSNGRFDGVDVS